MVICATVAIWFTVLLFGYLNFVGSIHLIACPLWRGWGWLEPASSAVVAIFGVVSFASPLSFSCDSGISVAWHGHGVISLLITILVIALLALTIRLLTPILLRIVSTESAIVLLLPIPLLTVSIWWTRSSNYLSLIFNYHLLEKIVYRIVLPLSPCRCLILGLRALFVGADL